MVTLRRASCGKRRVVQGVQNNETMDHVLFCKLSLPVPAQQTHILKKNNSIVNRFEKLTRDPEFENLLF